MRKPIGPYLNAFQSSVPYSNMYLSLWTMRPSFARNTALSEILNCTLCLVSFVVVMQSISGNSKCTKLFLAFWLRVSFPPSWMMWANALHWLRLYTYYLYGSGHCGESIEYHLCIDPFFLLKAQLLHNQNTPLSLWLVSCLLLLQH